MQNFVPRHLVAQIVPNEILLPSNLTVNLIHLDEVFEQLLQFERIRLWNPFEAGYVL